MKTHTQVLIIGGGSLGVSLLYHLTKEGWTDVMLVEKGEITSGSTWHAAGLCSNFIGNMTVAKIHQYSIELYRDILPKETGEPTPFHTTGSLRIGYSALEEEWFNNLLSRSKNVPCAFNFISKEEAQELNPLMDFSRARTIVSTPDDGHVDPTSVVMPLSQLARANGATIERFNRVLEINPLDSGEWQVVTEKGTIIAEHVVNAAGCFAPQVANMVGVQLPIVNLEHQYLVTDAHEAIKALDFELPVCRDSYSCSYIRQEGDGFLVGPYETFGSKPWALNGVDWGFDRELFQGDLTRLMPFLERCMELTPAFAEVGVSTIINGPITHTPDDNLLAGPQAGLQNFWNLCGSSIGIAQGGVGKFMAQWMVHGQTEINMAPLDSRRFSNWADQDYCITKGIESYEVMYTAMGANENRHVARAKRTSPLYAELAANGAEHGVVQGYEKPLWFKTLETPKEASTWSRSEAHYAVAQECQTIHNSAGISDVSGSAKFKVTGKDANIFLNQLSANKLPKKGRIGLTLLHNRNGGIVSELSITCIDEENYYLQSAIAAEHRDFHWLQTHAKNFNIHLENVTDSIGAVLVTGPKSRDVLQHCTEADLSNAAMPWLSSKNVIFDSASVQLTRVSYVGELGYELHMPTWQLMSIYESLQQAGEKVCSESKGLCHFGGYTMNCMRMEKAYRAWGHEFTEEISAVEAGMQRFVDTSRDFIGRDNLVQRMQNSVDQQLVFIVFDDDIPCECWGNEAVYSEGILVGLTTSGAFGHRVGRSLAFAYVSPEINQQSLPLQVLTTLGMRHGHVELNPVFDPDNARLKS